MSEVIEVSETAEYLVLHRLGFAGIERTVGIGVEVRTENLAKKGVKLPAHAYAGQFSVFELKGRGTGYPDMGVGISRLCQGDCQRKTKGGKGVSHRLYRTQLVPTAQGTRYNATRGHLLAH